MLGLVIVAVAGVAFYVTSPARRATGVTTTASTAAPAPPPTPMPLLAVIDAGPTPSGASSVMAKPPISPLGPNDVLPDPPLVIGDVVPAPFDLPDGGCPTGTSLAKVDSAEGCQYAGDGGMVEHGPWVSRRGGFREEGQMFEGHRMGPWRIFDADGHKILERYYGHEGRIHGPERKWNARGEQTSEVWYVEGALHGVAIRREGEGEVRTRWYLGRRLSEEYVGPARPAPLRHRPLDLRLAPAFHGGFCPPREAACLLEGLGTRSPAPECSGSWW